MAQTTVIPFGSLPSCAAKCGVLYDVNGACVPPAKPAGDAGTYASCFCGDARVAPLVTGTVGVCDSVCTGSGEMGSIHNWMTSYCAADNRQGGGAQTTTSNSASTTSTAGGSGTKSSGISSAGNGGTWLSHHWQWVIFIVVVVLGITGIWVGACIWRRRYLRKRDRQYALGKSLRRHSGLDSDRSVHMPQAGFFDPATISSANVYDSNPEKPAPVKKGHKKLFSRS